MRHSTTKRIRKPTDDGKGYHRSSFYLGGGRDGVKTRMPFIHTLVMEAFVGPKPAGHDIDHINSVRDDNRLVNLRYLPHSENRAQGGLRGLTAVEGERHGMAKITEHDVREIRLMRRRGLKLRQIAEALGGRIKIANICHIAMHKTWTHIKY